MNRILWNRRAGNRDPGDIDEIVIQGAVSVHVEQMNDRCWWIGIRTEDGYWSGNFSATSRGVMTFGEQENEGVEWDRDDTHEPEVD